MNTQNLIGAVLIIGIGTFLFRFIFIFFFGKFQLPVLLQKAMRFVPPAVLSALVFPALVVQNKEIMFTLENPRLIAGMLAMLVAWKSQNLFLTMMVGLTVFWFLTLI